MCIYKCTLIALIDKRLQATGIHSPVLAENRQEIRVRGVAVLGGVQHATILRVGDIHLPVSTAPYCYG